MGTIYEIICWTTGRRYIGKTIHSLGTRLQHHEDYFKHKRGNNSASLVLEHGNYEIYELEKIEDKNQLKKKEKNYIQHTDCVNTYDGHFDKKKWYEANKERIKEKYKERYACDCGSNVNLYQKSQHLKSKKHQNYLANL